MPQSPAAVGAKIVAGVVNPSPLVQPVTLSTGGNLTVVGAPGGPVIFTGYGALVLSALGSNFGPVVAGRPPAT